MNNENNEISTTPSSINSAESKKPWQAPEVSLLEVTEIEGGVNGLQETDAGSGFFS